MLFSDLWNAFQQLKDLLTSSPALVFPKFGPGCEFILETDASYIRLKQTKILCGQLNYSAKLADVSTRCSRLRAVLSQQQEDGSVHPIAYASRSLDQHEQNYGVTELETLGLV